MTGGVVVGRSPGQLAWPRLRRDRVGLASGDQSTGLLVYGSRVAGAFVSDALGTTVFYRAHLT